MPFHYFWMPSLNGKLVRRWFWKVLTSHHDTCVALCVWARVSVRVNVRVCVSLSRADLCRTLTHMVRERSVLLSSHTCSAEEERTKDRAATHPSLGSSDSNKKHHFINFSHSNVNFFHPIRDREQKELEFCGQQGSFSTLDERLIWKTNFANHPLMMKHGSKGSGASKKKNLRNYSER